ncbi:24-hydroxycholesterol 7-alpha-hydroxylase [Ctenodactylus gundi]
MESIFPAALVVALACVALLLLVPLRGSRRPPCIRGWLPWIGAALEFGKAPLEFIERARIKYGPVFTVCALGTRMTFVTEEEGVHVFLKSKSVNFELAVQNPVYHTASVPKDIFLSLHEKLHTAMKGKMGTLHLHQFAGQLTEEFHDQLESLGTRGCMDLNKFVRHILYASTVNVLFKKNLFPTQKGKIEEFYRHFQEYDEGFEYGSQIPEWLLRNWSRSKQWLLALFEKVTPDIKASEPAEGASGLLLRAAVRVSSGSDWGDALTEPAIPALSCLASDPATSCVAVAPVPHLPLKSHHGSDGSSLDPSEDAGLLMGTGRHSRDSLGAGAGGPESNSAVNNGVYMRTGSCYSGNTCATVDHRTRKEVEKEGVVDDADEEIFELILGHGIRDEWCLCSLPSAYRTATRQGSHPDEASNHGVTAFTSFKQTVMQAVLDVVEAETDGQSTRFGLLLLWASLTNAVPITFWTLAFVLSHPDIYRTIMEGIASVFGRAGKYRIKVSEDELKKLFLIKWCILETIRLRAPGAITRKVVEPVTILDYTVPPGDLLMLSPFWLHRNPKYFPEPESFKPERWKKADLEKHVFLDGFMAFGGGKFQCPGRWFALFEIQICIVLVLYKYGCSLLDPVPKQSDLHLVGVPQPERQCRIKYEQRHGAKVVFDGHILLDFWTVPWRKKLSAESLDGCPGDTRAVNEEPGSSPGVVSADCALALPRLCRCKQHFIARKEPRRHVRHLAEIFQVPASLKSK